MDHLFFDTETTGPDTTKDRIVELSIKIVTVDGKVILNKSKRYNPGKKISEEATKVHGISDHDVVDCPKFSEDARKLAKLFKDKVICGYNIMVFDLPILLNEFERAKVEVELSGKFLDMFKIEQKISPRTLSNVYEQYTGQKLEGAHGAQADTDAVHTVFEHQLERIKELFPDKEKDYRYELSGTKDIIDYQGKLKRDEDGYLCYTFGKNKNLRVIDDPKYVQWILDPKQNFQSHFKKLIQAEMDKYTKQNFSKTTKRSSLFDDDGEVETLKTRNQGFYQPIDTGDDLPF